MAPPPPALRPLLLRAGSSQALLLGRPGPGAGRGGGGGARRGWGRDRDGEDVQGRGRGGRRGHARVVDAAAVALRPLEFPDDLVVLVQEALELRQPRRRLRPEERELGVCLLLADGGPGAPAGGVGGVAVAPASAPR